MAQIFHPDAFETQVPYDPTGASINTIGDEYKTYISGALGAQTALSPLSASVAALCDPARGV